MQPIAEAVTDAQGDLALKLPRFFRGMIYFPRGPAMFSTMVPTLFAVYPPPENDLLVGPMVTLVSVDELNALLAQGKSAGDPSLGHVFGVAMDCANALASGVAVACLNPSAKTLPFYLREDGLSVATGETDVSGRWGFFNVPPGQIGLEGKPTRLGGTVSSRYTTLVRAGMVTFVPMVPTP
ncbi:MAG: hypothetical protein HOO96_42450 [Polyangiaceae bacterium]|nr:hypothetical protein [Polyangiaceae bacterium]